MSPKLRETFASLQVRNFRLFAEGQVVSLTGTWMQRVAQDWLVLQLSHDSGTAIGVVTALQFLPILLFGLYGGVLADRFDKRLLLKVANASMLLCALTLGILDATGVVQLWHVYALAFLLGLASVLDTPVRHSFVGELVPRDVLPNAVSLNSAVFNSARIVGPAVAGVMITTIGTASVFFVNAASYVLVYVNLNRMNQDELYLRIPDDDETPSRIREGFDYIRRSPHLLAPILLVAWIGMFGFNFQITTALMAKLQFHRNAASYGLLGTCLATGSLLGALLAARRVPRPRVYIGAGILFGLMEVACGLIPNYLSLALILIPTGFVILTFTTGANATLQLRSEPRLRGRVASFYVFAFLGGSPIGAPLIGWIGGRYGPRWPLIVGGVLCALGALAAGLYLLQPHLLRVGARRPAGITQSPRAAVVPRVAAAEADDSEEAQATAVADVAEVAAAAPR